MESLLDRPVDPLGADVAHRVPRIDLRDELDPDGACAVTLAPTHRPSGSGRSSSDRTDAIARVSRTYLAVSYFHDINTMFHLLHINVVVDFPNNNSQCHFSNTNGVVDLRLQAPSDLARLVKNARTQRDLTQRDVADAVGITRQSLARLERGNGGTSFDTVLLILDHLGIHLDAATERHTAAPGAVATRGAAQAAADALAKRITPLIDSSRLEALNKQILGSLPQIDPSILPEIDTSGVLKQVEANLDPAALASIREASRGLTERLAIPGSVLIDPPRAVEAGSHATAEAEADPDLDTAGGAE